MSLRYRLALVAILFALGLDAQAWTPGTGSPNAVLGFSVDTTNRTDVLSFYNTIYFASQNYAADLDWAGGSVAGDLPGMTSTTFKNDVQRSVNFYRALAGVSTNITFNDTDSANDQLEALIISANPTKALTHFPDLSYTDYSTNGALAASHSNLAMGIYGPGAIDGYMMDPGSTNTEVGHRRWILFPQQSVMGTGDIPANGDFVAANALWINDTFVSVPAQFVSWPNSGYCPLPLLPARWSLSYLNADFTAATVTMTQGGTTVPCTIIYSDSIATNNHSIIGDNSIVWEPSGLPTSISADTPFTVTVSGIGGGGPASYTYTVTVFDPNVLGQTTTIVGSSSPPSNGAAYTFNSISEADAYDLQVSLGSTASWNEGAEASPAPQVIFNTTSLTDSNPLIQSAAGTVHSGANSFQLSFPSDVDGNGVAESYDFSDQNFEITRQVIPTATSELQFYELCRFALPTTTLSAQVSTDNGTTWTQVKSIPGVVPSGDDSTFWDQSFKPINVSLAAYAGQVILVRFVLSANGQSIDLGSPIAYYGFFIDDVTVTNSTQLTNIKDTTLAGNATSFTLNATTVGAPLQTGASYYLRLRPEVGLKYYGFGNYDLVTVLPPVTTTGYSNWVSTAYPTVTGGASGDFSGDGIPNGLKYAFGLNPTVRNSAASIPAPVASGSTMTLSFTAPAGAGGITYGAQSSTDLVTWTPVPDTGSGLNHFFQVNVTGSHLFMRHVISIAP